MTGKRVAVVWQTGYGKCHHATRSMTGAEMKAQGFTHFRIDGFLDVDDWCPACKEKRAQARKRAPEAGR